jgi:hypothetical protein
MVKMKIERIYEGERDTKYRDKINECIEYIMEQGYGAVIGNEELAKILGFNIELDKEYNKFKEKMCRIKNFLIEKGYVLKGVNGIGYYILKPKQVSGYVYHAYTRRIDNLLAKGEKILNYTPKVDLSDIRKEEISNLIDLNDDLINNVDTTIENSQYYKKKSYYDNLED